MKTLRYMLAALLLMALVAAPAFAEPNVTTAFSDLTDPADPVQTIEAVTANPNEIITAAEGEEATVTTTATVLHTAATAATQEATVPEAVFYGAAAKLTPLEYIQANALSLAALAAAALALVLAIAALAKTKQPGRRKMKDFF